MALITIDKTKVSLVEGDPSMIITAPCAEAGTAGMYYRYNVTTGYLEKGNATTAAELGADTTSGIVFGNADFGIGETISIALPGCTLDLGAALDALAFGASVYVADTDASLGDVAGTVSRRYGVVRSAFGQTDGSRLLKVG